MLLCNGNDASKIKRQQNNIKLKALIVLTLWNLKHISLKYFFGFTFECHIHRFIYHANEVKCVFLQVFILGTEISNAAMKNIVVLLFKYRSSH